MMFIIIFCCIFGGFALTFFSVISLDSCKNKKVYVIVLSVGIIFLVIGLWGVIIQDKKNIQVSSSDYSTEQTFYYEQNAIAISEQMFETEDGNMWIMKNVQLKKGEKYIVTFDNHDTEIITDDEIVDFIELNEKVD